MKFETQTCSAGRGTKERTKLFAPHSGGDLTFLHPPYGPDTYANVNEGLAVEQDNLKRPTMAETASLVHAAFNSDDSYSTEIKHTMRQTWLWAFTGTLFVPKEGAFIQDYPETRNGMPFMDQSDLEQKLNANDPNVRFVPFGYPVGEMTPAQLAQNAYAIELAGEEGAEKLAEVAEKFRDKPYLHSFESVDENDTRVSALYARVRDGEESEPPGFGNWLIVNAFTRGGNGAGRAFGLVRETGGASRAEK